MEEKEGYIKVQVKGSRGRLRWRYRVDPEVKIEREKERRLRRSRSLKGRFLAGEAEQLVVIIPVELKEKLCKIKYKERLTYSEIIVEALEEYLSGE